MILFILDLYAPRQDTVANFMDNADNLPSALRNPYKGMSGGVCYATDLHLGELQKLTDIPLKEITFDDLKQL